MKPMEVSEHPLMTLVSSKLARGRLINIDVDVVIKWPKPDRPGRYETFILNPRYESFKNQVTGQLLGIEKRGQSLNSPTIALHTIDASTGEEDWHYLFEWALDYLTIKKVGDQLTLTNRQPD